MRALNSATLMDMKWMVLRKLRQRAGIELVRARKNPNLSDFIDNRRINLVLDVGANTGQFGQLLRRRGYAGQIISFEPVKEAFRELESAARGDDLWTTANLALGPSSGVMAINISKNSQFSSFNDLRETAKVTLKRVSGVLLELPIINIYKDNWRFHEAVAYMNESGFVLAQVHPVNIHNRARDSATEFDCLFRPIDPTID